MAKSKAAAAAATNGGETKETTQTPTKFGNLPSNVEILPNGEIKLKRGRPADPNSDRHRKLEERAQKLAQGIELKRGRPADPNSERYKREMEKKAKLEQGIELKRGRPSDPTSERQQKLREREERIAKYKTIIAEANKAKTSSHEQE